MYKLANANTFDDTASPRYRRGNSQPEPCLIVKHFCCARCACIAATMPYDTRISLAKCSSFIRGPLLKLLATDFG